MRKPTRRAAALCLAGLAIVVVGLLASRHWGPRHPAVAAAERLFGERWYAVVFQHTPIGHYRARSGRTAAGDFEFHTTLRFRLRDGGETRMEDRFLFRRHPPHELLRASHLVDGPGGVRREVVIENGIASVEEAGAHWQTPLREMAVPGACARAATEAAGQREAVCPTARELTLAQYLAVETWLAAGVAVPGAGRRARAVDFDHLALVAQHWRVVDVDERGVELAKANASGPPGRGRAIPQGVLGSDPTTHIVLNGRFVPVRMEVGGLFVLQRVADEALARLWQRGAPLFADHTPGAPLDRPIRDPTALRRLVVAVEGDVSDNTEWLRRLEVESPAADAPRILTVLADPRRPANPAEAESAKAATSSFPVRDPELRALASRAIGDAPHEDSKVDALVRFVHGFLRYEDSATPRSVFETMRVRRGDCTEFADLYTTLARAAGLPAYTVVGLAYRPSATAGDPGEFALHAWNEVAVGGQWRGVDPTWGQTRLDATHIPIQADDVLAAAAALPQLAFRVVETAY